MYHMPHTSYALFKAIRSHRVDSPNVEVSARTGKPAACNQCHLDKTLDWTATKMSKWYGHTKPQLAAEHQTTAASLVWLMKGDAAQRAITAWTFSWDDAKAVSGSDWYAPYLAELLNDPYAPVRFIAFDAVRKLELHRQLPFDFVGGKRHFAEMRAQVLKDWKRPDTKRRLPELLMRPDGSVDQARLQRLLDQRDNRPITLPE